jgi:hypothetical protein
MVAQIARRGRGDGPGSVYGWIVLTEQQFLARRWKISHIPRRDIHYCAESAANFSAESPRRFTTGDHHPADRASTGSP